MARPSAVTTKPQEGNVNDRTLFFMSLALFFIWGFATVLIDILIPKFRGLYNLSYAEAMLTQSAFFLGYFVFSIPAGNLVAKVGYMRGIIAGLGVMIGGCILFVLATHVGIYPGFLFALFVFAFVFSNSFALSFLFLFCFICVALVFSWNSVPVRNRVICIRYFSFLFLASSLFSEEEITSTIGIIQDHK
jgi:MFS family permease